MVGCCVVGCTNSTQKGYILKRFPSDPERRKVWAAKVNRENWTPTNSSRLCEVHFTPEMFEQNRADGKRRLRWNAIPTIFPHVKYPRIVITKRPTMEYNNEELSFPTVYVEPGLTEYTYYEDLSIDDTKDFLAGYSRLKEEADSDSMIDFSYTTFIKQEDESYLDSQHAEVKIKIEPDISECDTTHHYVS